MGVKHTARGLKLACWAVNLAHLMKFESENMYKRLVFMMFCQILFNYHINIYIYLYISQRKTCS